jgi:NADH-quinone oxidoreductase subunit M
MVALASLGVVLAAGYILWMVQRVLYGEVTHEVNRSLPDLSAREFAVLIPLVVLAIFMGVASPLFTRLIEPSVQSLVSETNARMRRPVAPPAAAALMDPAAGGGR